MVKKLSQSTEKSTPSAKGSRRHSLDLDIEAVTLVEIPEKYKPMHYLKTKQIYRRIAMENEKWVTVVLGDGTRKVMPEHNLEHFKKTMKEMEAIAKEADWTEEEIRQAFSIQEIVTERE